MKISDRKTQLSTAFAVIFIALIFAPGAHANSRFHVVNQTGGNVKVIIYNGDDSSCDMANKEVGVQNEDTKSMGCAGGGKHRCKIRLKDTGTGNSICNTLKNTCTDFATIIHNNQTISLADDGSCTIE